MKIKPHHRLFRLPYAFLITLMASLTNASPPFSVNDVSSTYKWDRIPVGGGGFQTGVVTSTNAPGLLYGKGDVMGLHRRMPDQNHWEQTTWSFNPDQGFEGGCGGVAIHPENPAIAYTIFGGYYGNTNGLFKTENYGKTWSKLHSIFENTNLGEERLWADNVAVDPANPEIVYFGTRRDGLFRTLNGGASFDKKPYPEIPLRPDAEEKVKGSRTISGSVGSRSIVIDSSEYLKKPKRSKTVYVNVYSQGLWISRDGGESFSPIEGGPTHIRWMRLSSNQTLYVTANLEQGLWKYDGTWKQLAETSWHALAVDPHDLKGKKLIVSRVLNPGELATIARSLDGGQTWETLKKSENGYKDMYPSNWAWRESGAGISSLDFDQAIPNRLYLSDAFGIWVTEDPWSTPIIWKPMHEGLEGIVGLSISAPPKGKNVYPLYSGNADANNFSHANPTTDFPSAKIAPIAPPEEKRKWLNFVADYDFCMTNPKTIYAVMQAHDNHQYLVKTESGGATADEWSVIASSYKKSSLPQNPVTWNGRSRKLAVSATDPNSCLVAGLGGYGNWITNDGGKSWKKLEGVTPKDHGFITQSGTKMFGTDKPICADRVNGDYFYAIRMRDFYRSHDKGKNGSWTKAFTFPNERKPNHWRECSLTLAAAPNHEGHVVVNLGKNGLWFTKDKGDIWTRVNGVQDCRSAGWGKKSPTSNHSTLYIHAKINDHWGIYRSTDLAQTWERITPAHIQLASISNLTGDLQTYGTVYFTSRGYGMGYGELKQYR